MRLNVIILLLLFAGMLFGQTRRIVLLEEATNASCGPCAYYNPGLQQFYAQHFGGVISVRYHAWWPGNDPMYQSAKDDCVNRIHYYNINGVPNYVMDGKLEGVPASISAMQNQMEERLSIPSPLKLHVKAQFDDDSVKARITLIVVDTVKATKLFLRVAVTQRMVSYANPPGSNGEKDFGEVLRKMLPTAMGTGLNTLSVGDTLNFRFSTPVKNDWDSGDLGVVAWVQSDATKEILQSALHFPTTIITDPNPDITILTATQSSDVPYFIFNDTPDTVHVTLMLKNKNAPNDWHFNLKANNTINSEIPLEILPGDTAYFSLQVQAGQRGTGEVTIFSQNDDDDGFYGEGYGYGYSVVFSGLVPQNSDILLIDDDGGAGYEKNFTKILDAHNYDYICLAENFLDTLAKCTDLNQYKLIIWNASWAFPVFTPSDVRLLSDYLKKGGNALLFGQDVAWDVFDPAGESHFAEAESLMQNYFSVRFLEDNSKGTKLLGIESDPISHGLSFELERPYGFNNLMPDAIEPLSGAQPVFKYNTDKIGAIRFDGGNFRTIIYGISFEEIEGDANREAVLLRSIDWATGVTALESKEMIPGQTALLPNYPNPFNPSTTIHYTINVPGKTQVNLAVYNVLGQKVRQVVQAKQASGEYKFTLNASDLPSGIYFCRLKTGTGFSAVRKMILMR